VPPDGAHTDDAESALARLRRWGGDRLARDMAALFAAAVPERVAAARRALSARDRTAVADAMHALKASCAQLGGAEAAARCVVAERAAREASPDDALAVALEQAADACAAHVAWLGQALADDARQGRGDA
jgi:HPt (histidine-containing phosphotransfer) domain-containing protein